MEAALIENNHASSDVNYEHDWIHILYMGITAVFFFIQICQRVSIDILYSSSKYLLLLFDRFIFMYRGSQNSSKHSLS